MVDQRRVRWLLQAWMQSLQGTSRDCGLDRAKFGFGTGPNLSDQLLQSLLALPSLPTCTLTLSESTSWSLRARPLSAPTRRTHRARPHPAASFSLPVRAPSVSSCASAPTRAHSDSTFRSSPSRVLARRLLLARANSSAAAAPSRSSVTSEESRATTAPATHPAFANCNYTPNSPSTMISALSSSLRSTQSLRAMCAAPRSGSRTRSPRLQTA
jgi:hypothetical protein